ncbi:hypothetical protein Tco_0877574 [Tanacetum coccineum]|uniref:Uncharacterized protein n=1 Tax=Tanacetum coccineum TaxID=301880 RepID=A0ABQ5BYN8_9ASTR
MFTLVFARLVDTESGPEEAPYEGEELQSLGSRIPLMGKEFVVVEPLGTRTDSSHSSASLDSTAPLSPDHPLTYVSPTPTPTRASFHSRTARMTVRAQPVMPPGHSAKVIEAMALSDSTFRKRYRSSYEKPSLLSSLAFLVRKRYRGTSELILDTDSEEDEIGEEDSNKDEGHGLDDEDHGLDDEDHSLDDEGRSLDEEGLGLGYRAFRRREIAVDKDQVYSTFEVGQGSGSIPDPERRERVSTLRQPTLTTWIDPEDGIAYIDFPSYLPPAPPAQTPPSPKWSSGSLPVSPTPSTVHSPIPLPMISLTVPLTIVSPVATPTATISINEDQFIEAALQRELQEMRGHVTALEQEKDCRER